MHILKINRQCLEDLCGFFLPVMMEMLEARMRIEKGTEYEYFIRVSLSVMQAVEKMLMRKYLTESFNFKIKFSEAEAIILMKLLLQFPLPADHFWRQNLRNNIVEQLHKQLV